MAEMFVLRLMGTKIVCSCIIWSSQLCKTTWKNLEGNTPNSKFFFLADGISIFFCILWGFPRLLKYAFIPLESEMRLLEGELYWEYLPKGEMD